MKRTQKSQKRTKFLLLLLVLTAILSITATYAWFSTQKDVEIVGMRLNVEVAESMQISLDGEKWTQSINIYNMRQFYGTYTGNEGEGVTIYQAKQNANTNYVPTELKPVSSAGEVDSGKLQLVQGTISGKELSGITLCSEADITATSTVADRQTGTGGAGGNDAHPYLVFDMYLRNVSARAAGTTDPLLMNAGSRVYVNTATTDDGEQEGKGVADTGLEYAARVGMIVYNNTVSINATDTTVDPDGEGPEVAVTTTVAEQIRGITADGNEVAAIWEPNNLNHTSYVVANNSMGITKTTDDAHIATLAITKNAADADENAGLKIADVYDDENTLLSAVKTFKPAYTLDGGVTTKTGITNINEAAVGLKPNMISKVRVYVWLEGQDPDCVDLASTGDKLSIDLKLTKNPSGAGTTNTYVDADPDPKP